MSGTAQQFDLQIPKPPMRRGWCPGALAPMQSGDGLIVRIRPRVGTLSVGALRTIVNCAHDFGNGIVELTRRANIQIRGVGNDTLDELQNILRQANLVDDTAKQESVRNIMVSPLSGLDPTENTDMRNIAIALESRLRDDETLWTLPAKFSFLLDAGGDYSLKNEPADIRVAARSRRDGTADYLVAINRGNGNLWLGTTNACDPNQLANIIADIARAAVTPSGCRVRDLGDNEFEKICAIARQHLSPLDAAAQESSHDTEYVRRLGRIDFDTAPPVIALAAPFGSLDAQAWLALTRTMEVNGAAELRMSPWRTVYIPIGRREQATNIMETAQDSGFITDADNPILRIEACPGAPACKSAFGDTRAAARTIGAHLHEHTDVKSVHISGCSKGCARSQPADIMLTACDKGYGIAHNATAATSPDKFIVQDNISGALKAVSANEKPGVPSRA